MSPLRAAFEKARREGRPALVTYVMAGDPSIDATRALIPRLVEAGADIVELGMPFSDPMADGPVLQAAALRAITGGTTVAKILALAGELRNVAPIVLMGYLNPVLSYGEAKFAKDASAAGVAGVIIPDLPSDEAVSFAAALRESHVAFIPLVAPTTTPERIGRIASHADGFVYYVSVTGVTGTRANLPVDLAERIRAARTASAPAPVAVGFGIGTPEQARLVGEHAEGIVVGSAIVRALQERGPDAAVALVRSLRQAIEGIRPVG